MANRGVIALGIALVAACIGGYFLFRPAPTAPVLGVVRTTEIRVAPEVGGQLAAIKVGKGDHVRAGDIVAELSAVELSASVEAEARNQISPLQASARTPPTACQAVQTSIRGRL